MSYNYQEQKHVLFTEEGQEKFISIRDSLHGLIEKGGCARMGEIIDNAKKTFMSSWEDMAAVDRAVELNENIFEVTKEVTYKVAGQHRIFSQGRKTV